MSIKSEDSEKIRSDVLVEISILSSNILDMILNTMDGDTGSIMLLDKTSKTLKIISQRGLSEDIVENIRVSLNNSIAGYAVKMGNAFILNKGGTFLGQPLKREDIGSSIVFPIINDNEKIGVININRSPEKEPFSIEDLELAGLLVRYSSVLMKGVTLYSKTLQSARIARTSYRTLRSVTRYKNVSCIMKKLLKVLLEITEGSYGIVGVYEDDRFRIVYSIPDDIDKDKRKELDKITNIIKTTGKEIILQDLLAFPIMFKEELLGTVYIKLQDKHLESMKKGMIKLLLKDAGIVIKNLITCQSQREIVRKEERTRITNILHDRISQGITEGIIRLQYIKKFDLPEEILKEMIRLEASLKEILNDIRCIMFEEKPITLRSGLFDTLRRYIEVIESSSGIKFNLIFSGNEELIPKRIKEILFSVIKEAVVNIRRHSLASNANVELRVEENCVCINIEDNGIGFDSESYQDNEDSFGIRIMRERISSLGGIFNIEGAIAKGTKIDIYVPLKEENGANKGPHCR